MTDRAHRITLRIDRIVADHPGLDRAALEQALRAEIGRLVTAEGPAAIGRGGHRTQLHASVAPGPAPLQTRVAAAAVKAVKP